MLSCWLRDPTARPTFGELKNHLLQADIEFNDISESQSAHSIVSSIVNIIIDSIGSF